MAYDFENLSPSDFERLSADLLGAEIGVTFEEFGTGPDGGIDLRYVPEGGEAVIVQCKHYPNSPGSYVRSRLKKELNKVQKEKPSRYIITTSARLIRKTKDAIAGDFAPFVLKTGDVLGRDDIEALLRKHKDVERRHIKLWLPSEPALIEALNRDTVVRSKSLVEQAKQQIKLYVPNPSIDKTQDLLENQHICIISGQAGIGKTMLARIIGYDYARQGWQIIEASSDISEANNLWDDNFNQLFIYDDFLGRTMVSDKLSKNEDQRLLDFMSRVHRRSNKRFILTTREYILSQARSEYPRLDDDTLDPFSYVIPLNVYTRPIRGKILYNHLYFAKLPRTMASRFVRDHAWREVVDHPHYNPRSIEIGAREAAKNGGEDLTSLLLEVLNNPGAVWAEQYQKELTGGARTLLCVLASLPEQTSLDRVRRVWIDTMQVTGWPDIRPVFESVADEIDGTFVTISRVYSHQYFEFLTPAIRDWLTQWLASHPEDLLPVLVGTSYFDQLEVLAASRDRGSSGAPQHQMDLRKRLNEYRKELRSAVERTVDEVTETEWGGALENRLTGLARLYGAIPDPVVREMLTDRLSRMSTDWPVGYGRRMAGLNLIRTLHSVGLEKPATPLRTKMSAAIIDNVDTLEEVGMLVSFASIEPDILPYISEPDLILTDAITDYNDTADLTDEGHNDYARSVVRSAAALFGLSADDYLAELSDVEESDDDDASYDPSEMAYDAYRDSMVEREDEDADIDRLFATL